MDFTKFTNENFDAKEWINEVFQNTEAQSNREQYATTLVMKLQLLIQEVAKSLEDTSQQIVQSMPRTKREISVMQQEALLLQSKMKAVEQDVQKVEQETATAMDGLLLIDLAKSRMMEVEKALKEVDNWTAFTRDIEDVFASGNPETIADRLIGMQQSLAVLGSKVHDYRDRHDLLERLKDQFIAAVSPSVVASLTSQSSETAQYFSKMFSNLQRSNEFENYCHKVVKADINKQWADCLANEELTDVVSILNAFYDSLLSLWFAKVKWFTVILKNAGQVMCASFGKSLSSLDPSMESIIMTRLDSSKDKINVLVSARSATENIVRSMDAYLNGTEFRDSKLCEEFFDEFYKPYSFFVVNYQQYEQSYLLAKLNQWNFDNAGWSSLNRLSKSSDAVFAESFEALERCQTFTNGYGIPYLIKALNTYFENYLSILKKFLEALPNVSTVETDQNWDRFENSLKFTEICGNILNHLSKLDDSIELSVQILKGKLTQIDRIDDDFEKSVKVAGSFDRVILSNPSIKMALDKFVVRLEDGKFLKETKKQAEKFNKRVHLLAVDVLLVPIKTMMSPVSKLPCWPSTNVGEALSADLPSFGLAPQEYITKIGQYLMTFAHHLEPYLSQENISLRISLNLSENSKNFESSDQTVRFWLECAGNGLMQAYIEAISNIKDLSPSGCKQLIADVEYLCNVLEDLGISPSQNLSNLVSLLKMSKDEIREASTEKFNTKILSVVKEMRRFK